MNETPCPGGTGQERKITKHVVTKQCDRHKNQEERNTKCPSCPPDMESRVLGFIEKGKDKQGLKN